MTGSLHTEKIFVVFTWLFVSIIFAYALILDLFINPNAHNLLIHLSFIGLFAVVNVIRKYLIELGVINLDYFYLRSRLIEIIFVCFAFFYLGLTLAVGAFILFSVFVMTVLEGRQSGLHTAVLSTGAAVFFALISGGLGEKHVVESIAFLFFPLASFAGWYIGAQIHEESEEQFKRKQRELVQLQNDKDTALQISREMEEKIEKNKEKLKKLENINEQMKVSLEKYYEFHHISSIIGSIFDVNGLLKFINETIIEIIEADYSTIFLFEPKRGSLEIQNTNITNEDSIGKLKKSINNDIVYDIIENGSPFVVNVVDSSDYEFVRGREVKSFICMPISTIKKKYGVVLIESNEYNRFHDENQKLVMLIGHQLSTSIENLELYKRMKELATTDGLTGIFNRLYFQERLSKELKIAHEHDYPLSLVIFDIDHFKRVNDTYSHLIGDRVLKLVTSVVKNSIRRSDMIARYGGEEFIILFPNMDIKRAQETCEILREKIQATHLVNREVNLSVTVSFGIANFPHNAYSEENLVKAADRALYEAKEGGRNQVRVSQEKLF